MRYSRPRRSSDSGLFGGVGWLFADLMLALVVIAFLASVIVPEEPEPPSPLPPATTTSTTVPTTTTTTTSTPPPPERLAREPIKADVFVDDRALLAGDPAAVSGMQAAVGGQLSGLLAGRRAGFVLTFGTSSSADIQRGIRTAGQFNDLVLRNLGAQFRDTAYRNYFQNGPDRSKITLEIFVFER
jgi:hypothetical protein